MNNRVRRIFNKKFCFNGSIKSICPITIDPSVYQPQVAGPGLKPTMDKLSLSSAGTKDRGNREAHSDHFVDKTTGPFFSTTKSLRFTSQGLPARLPEVPSAVKALVHDLEPEEVTNFPRRKKNWIFQSKFNCTSPNPTRFNWPRYSSRC